MAPEQYSTPGREVIDHTLKKIWVFDIVRYQKSSIALLCDLKLCYNRIVYILAVMAMERAGTTSYLTTSMYRTIDAVEHCDFSSIYGGFEGYIAVVMGVGQGNGCGPQMQAAVILAIFEVLRRKGLATHFCMLITKTTLDLCRFAWVDDTNLLQSMNKGGLKITLNKQLTICGRQWIIGRV